MLAIGSKAPPFEAQDQSGKTQKLSDHLGKWVLLYFYPKDFTSGCTTEACSLRDNFDAFKNIDAVVLGVSTDTVESHAGFAEKYELPFPLIADPDKKIVKAYGAEGFAKRISYLIDPNGFIAKAYEKVKPAEHAAEVLADLAALSQ